MMLLLERSTSHSSWSKSTAFFFPAKLHDSGCQIGLTKDRGTVELCISGPLASVDRSVATVQNMGHKWASGNFWSPTRVPHSPIIWPGALSARELS